MTTITRTWTFSWSNVPSQATLDAQGKAVLFAIKQAYKLAGWTVDQSSDGSTASSSDLWVTAANIIWAAAGVSHSWISLKSPAGMLPNSKFVYHTYKCSTGATSQHLVNVTHSTVVSTGGTATADPSHASGKGYTSKQFLKSSTVANSKYHIIYNTVGDILAMISGDGSGFIHSLWGCLTAEGYSSGAFFPCINLASYNSSIPGAANSKQFYNNSSHCVVFAQDGTTPSSSGGILLYATNPTPVSLGDTSTLGGSLISGTYFSLPAFLFYATGSGNATLGTLIDVTVAPEGTSLAYPTEEPSIIAPVTVDIGGLWVPCGGVVPNFI